MSNLFPTSRNFFFPQFFDQAFDSFFTPMNQPSVDIEEKDHSYEVTMDLPGMNKEDINVTYNNNLLTVEANQDQETEKKDDKANYIRRERVSRSFKRQFVIDNVQFEGIECKYENGVLNIVLPKSDQQLVENNHRIEIQ
ncbi:Hsp20/alpha crystallin family protein [Rummeliibacillus suwonensis]|uniref:Hsp20/alpha crystallin family protein n=1 Tax=Rummeliibacillus suwonensis TaxID=1306154 RepID=UPI0011B6F00A|nr:Hsp20/alpha crystallin family protein [Rummeliibacillus suwonensis]MBO2537045.1 Hsp20/alpha crystallin family protein [Rummeliibacillus suwonensis]